MSDPLFSVNIVTRNRQEKLKHAILSVYSQKYRPIEVVVVDNASSDGTPQVVKKEWPQIKLIQLHRNIGCQPGRNIGMKNCNGKYIFNLDDDGVLAPEAIESIVRRFEYDDDLAVIESETPPLEKESSYIADNSKNEKWISSFKGGAHAIRASVLKKAGYFPEFPRTGAEWVLAARILDCGYEMLYLPNSIMFHPAGRYGEVLRIHTYYAGWHYLKRAFMILPFPECLFSGIWNCFRGLEKSIKNKCTGIYIRGVFRFFLDIPDLLEQRKPIKRDTMKKMKFLMFNNITQKKDICKYKDRSTLKMFHNRWKKWRNLS